MDGHEPIPPPARLTALPPPFELETNLGEREATTSVLLTNILASREYAAEAPMRPEPYYEIKHFMTQEDSTHRALATWTNEWSHMPAIRRLRKVNSATLHDALQSLHKNGYMISRDVVAYQRTVNNYSVGWRSDPIQMFQIGIRGAGENDEKAFDLSEWKRHVSWHENKIGSLRELMHNLLKSKCDMEHTWNLVRNDLRSDTRNLVDTWWKDEAVPMIQDAVCAIGVLQLPKFKFGQHLMETVDEAYPHLDLEIRKQIAQSIGFGSAPADHKITEDESSDSYVDDEDPTACDADDEDEDGNENEAEDHKNDVVAMDEDELGFNGIGESSYGFDDTTMDFLEM